MFGALTFQVSIWTLFNRMIYNGMYFFCKPLFKYDDNKLERISSNIVSSIHGLRCVNCVVHEIRNRDILFTYNPSVNYDSIIQFSIGYFIYDLLNDMRIQNLKLPFFIHHSMSIFTGMYLYSLGLTQLYLVALFVELSNMNLNIKDIMDILDLKHLQLYTINGILFSLTFFISRILYGPVALRSAYILSNEIDPQNGLHNIPLMLSTSFVTLNIYWFYKIVKIVVYKYHNYYKS